MSFSLLTYNILRGGAGREDALASVIRASEADLVVLQEATSPAVVARLAESTGMAQWMARRGSSLAFLSRQPVVSYRWRRPAWSQHAILETGAAGRPGGLRRALERRSIRTGPSGDGCGKCAAC